MKSVLKSIGSIIAGFATIFILAVALDHLLEHTGLMQTETFSLNPGWVIAVVIAGRLLFDIIGAYITALLAPTRPVQHALILGVLGLLMNAMSAVMMWAKTPYWFSIILILLPLPCAWIGAKLAKPKQYEI